MEYSLTKVVKFIFSVPLTMGKGKFERKFIMGSTSTITINTNLSALTCQKYLSDATKGMNTAMERLSTGFKINSGADDAAEARWFDLHNLPKLGFHHEQIILDFLGKRAD